ncbi:amino acid transporter [Saccharomycopsis crataegensis]|uniref:Protein BTN n=1 Tax=Saccharomycopsis crataegensis TaxID=43959 RepID=A0AAV5QLP7_9ASCO|nr:amino acid transporter [Saccharomycopsis crataegensis]
MFGSSVDRRIAISFWLFGLINNALYVVILSAASDLVGPNIPKALVLFFDVAPSFIVKLSAPFYLKFIPYNFRIFICVAFSCFGMVILSGSSDTYESSLGRKMLGITFASLSSGLGEVTFLSLTHYYKDISLNAWSSGTGFAGIFGSFNFMVMTTWWNISTRNTLYSFSILPFTFIAVFWKVLPTIPDINDTYLSLRFLDMSPANNQEHEDSVGFLTERQDPESGSHNLIDLKHHIQATAKNIAPLVVPYMIPLSTVYFAEYLINQGISPTLLFPLKDTPFSSFRDIYVSYATLYQVGVFISRSSAPFFRLKNLYLPAILQIVNLLLCVIQSMYLVVPSIYFMFIIIFYEGLLGGASYVNTFMSISEEVSLEIREFALGTVSISDSLGVGLASLIGMWTETSLCDYQVSHGRDWCKKK